MGRFTAVVVDQSQVRQAPRLGPAILGMSSGLILLLTLPATAGAQEWRLEPEIRVGAEYDDNARLRSDPAEIEAIDGYIIEGSAGIAYLTQRTTFRITPKLRSRVYDEDIDVDSDDQFLDLDWTHETLKSQFSLHGDYSRESTRTAERVDAGIDVDDPDDIPTDDTGIGFANVRRERFRLAPEWNYDLTERMGIGARFSYTDTSYEETLGGRFVDYNDSRVVGSLLREFSTRNRGFISATARRYENDFGIEIDGLGVGIGFESEISQTTRLHAEVGFEDSERSDTGVSDSNFVADLNLVRNLETITLLAQYRRNISSGGNGRIAARDSLNFRLDKQFTERVSGGLGVRAYQSDSLGDQAVTDAEREAAAFYAQFNVALSRAFSLEADYRYTRIDRNDIEGTADSNSIILWLIYRPTPIISSR